MANKGVSRTIIDDLAKQELAIPPNDRMPYVNDSAQAVRDIRRLISDINSRRPFHGLFTSNE